MAKADYICCDVCNCKVIYDGSWGTRDNWKDDEWPTIICAECTKAMKPKLTSLVADQRKSKQPTT